MIEADPLAIAEIDWDEVLENRDPAEEPVGDEALRTVIVSFEHGAFEYGELEVLESDKPAKGE